MILRKPYAFFIKNFRLMHLILSILIGYLIVKTYNMYEFIGKYIQNPISYVGVDHKDKYISLYVFLVATLVILISIIIVAVLVRKKKPYLFYSVNITSMIGTIILFLLMVNAFKEIEIKLIDLKLIRAYKDIALAIWLLQVVAILITFARSSGFDVKKFDFGKELKELSLQEEDSEEVEINLNVNTNKFMRRFHRFIRYTKYYYLENVEIANAVILSIGVIVTVMFLIDTFVFNRTYLYNNYFNAGNFTLKIKDAYLLTEDNYGKKITKDNEVLVVLKIGAKVRDKDEKLENSRLALLVGSSRYYPVFSYRDKLLDLGTSYEEQYIKKQESNYLLVYAIPKNKQNKKMEFNYILGFNFAKKNIEPNIIHVAVAAKNLDGNKYEAIINSKEEIKIDNDLINKAALTFSDIDIKDNFLINYKACYKDKCYKSKENIKPILNTNYDKTLIKLEADSVNLSLPDIIKYYGKIEYKINEDYFVEDNLNTLIPHNNINKNTYYIEVNKDITKSLEVNLILDIRNSLYKYKIK